MSNPRWSSRYVFVLAAVGSAVGLGNIWKFPYIVGENGGGAFVLMYLFCIALVGIPVGHPQKPKPQNSPFLTTKTP